MAMCALLPRSLTADPSRLFRNDCWLIAWRCDGWMVDGGKLTGYLYAWRWNYTKSVNGCKRRHRKDHAGGEQMPGRTPAVVIEDWRLQVEDGWIDFFDLHGT